MDGEDVSPKEMSQTERADMLSSLFCGLAGRDKGETGGCVEKGRGVRGTAPQYQTGHGGAHRAGDTEKNGGLCLRHTATGPAVATNSRCE